MKVRLPLAGIFAFVFTTLSSVPIWALINIESVRQKQQTDGLGGKTQASLSGSKGNTEKNIVNFASTNSYKKGSHEYLLLGQYSYGETSKIRDTNNGSLHLRYAYKLKAHRYLEAFVQSTFNDFQNLKHRDLAGVGLRHQLVNTKKQFLYLGTGFFYESESLKMNTLNRTMRANIYISYLKKPTPDLELSLIAYYQPSLSQFKDFRIWSQWALEYRLFKAIALVNTLTVIHDSRPPATIDPTDITYTVGINVSY